MQMQVDLFMEMVSIPGEDVVVSSCSEFELSDFCIADQFLLSG